VTTVRSLSSLGSRSLARRKGRSALTATGVALGVALLFAVLVSNATVNRALDKLSQAWNGRTDVILVASGNGSAGLPPSIATKAAKLPDVEIVSPWLYSPAQLVTPGHTMDGGVVGVIPADDEKLAPTKLLTGRLERPGVPEVILNSRLADALQVKVGGQIHLGNAADAKVVTVVGINEPAVQIINVNATLVTSLEYAQSAGGKPGGLSGVSLALRKGTDAATWVDHHRGDLGPGIDPQVVRSYSSGFRKGLDNLQGAFAATAAVSLFVGAYLIYLTLSIAILERMRLYGTLRALGAFKTQVRRVVLAEAVALGAVSSAAGLALGVVFSVGLIRLTAAGVRIPSPKPAFPPLDVLAAFSVGVVTTVIAALIPARRAARMTAVDAMRSERPADTSRSRWPFVGLGVIGAGLLGYVELGRTVTVLSFCVLLVLTGSVLAVPLVLRPVAGLVGRMTRRLAPGVGRISVMHLVKERSQSASTLALVMVVLTTVFAVFASYVSNQRASLRILDKQYGADVQLYSNDQGFPPELEKTLLTTPGVARSTEYRFGGTRMWTTDQNRSVPQRLVAIDPSTYFDVASYPWLHGTDPSAKAALAEGGHVLLTAPNAAELGVGVGATITLDTAVGPKPFVVAGIYGSMGFGGGHIGTVVGIKDGQKFFRTGQPNAIDIVATPHTSASALRQRLLHINGGHGFFATTSNRVKADSERQLNGIFAIFFAIVLVGVLVGMLGLANTLAASVMQRYREIGVLRAVGTIRSQVRGIVLVESATLVTVAFVLSMPLGFVLSRMIVRDTSSSFGYELPYVYPWAAVPILAVLALIVGTVAAVAPARRAARLDPVAVLRFD
jgi:putative ABC transport system permease protein